MRFVVDTKAAVLIATHAASVAVDDIKLEDGQILVNTSQDLLENLSGPQLKDLHNNIAKERDLKPRRSDFKNKTVGAGKVFEMLFGDEEAQNAQQEETTEKKAKAAKARSPKKKTAEQKAAAAAKKKEPKERKARERKPDTKFAKLVKMFYENPGEHFDREAIMRKTGYKETSLIVRISKIRTNFMEKQKDKTQGGPEHHLGMAIVKHRATQTWSYEPEGNEALQFMEDRIKAILDELEAFEKAEAETAK